MSDTTLKPNSRSFKGIYETTAYVQQHTLLNRGITTLGGSTIPQCTMSNNKYEAAERAIMGGVYFVASYLTPILFIPFFNKRFLQNEGVINSLKDAQKNIILMSKKYLTPHSDIKKGLEETAKKLDKKFGNSENSKAFKEIFERYKDDPEKLKKALLAVHEKVLTFDFISTAAMWSIIPWIATETTEALTKRTDFSAGFDLKEQTPVSKEELKKSKAKKAFWNVVCCVVPGILFPKAVTAGLGKDFSKPEKAGFLQKAVNPILKKISEKPENFNYTSGTNMSKTIFAAIWLLASFPAKIISSRDENEMRDRALRDAGLFTLFFGGDFLINNITGRLADKFLGTKIMDTSIFNGKEPGFFEKFKMQMRNFNDIPEMKGVSPEVIKKTKTAGAALYWVSLLTNTAFIGFALPKLLNGILRKNIQKQSAETCDVKK